MAKKIIPSDPQCCAGCKFHKPNQDDEYGFCLRYPPVAAIDDEAPVMLWPITALAEWCGEFVQKTH